MMTVQRLFAAFTDSLYMWCRMCGRDIPLKDGCAHIAPWNNPRRRKPIMGDRVVAAVNRSDCQSH